KRPQPSIEGCNVKFTVIALGQIGYPKVRGRRERDAAKKLVVPKKIKVFGIRYHEGAILFFKQCAYFISMKGCVAIVVFESQQIKLKQRSEEHTSELQ